MSDFKQIWDEASAEEIEPPAGTYKVKIIRGEAKLSNAGDPKANVILEILDGELAGSHVDHFMWLAHPVSARISKEQLITYGLSNPEAVTAIEDLDDAIQKLIGTTAEVGISYKDGRMNVKVFGSRPPARQSFSDIPSDTEQKPAASFASAAGSQFGDDVPFD